MTTCYRCGAELAADDLVRHEHEGILLVHCPDCRAVLGVYNQHRQQPRTDAMGR